MERTSRLVELFRYLQDPQLVAGFQALCGVRGTFPAAGHDGGGGEADRTHEHNNGACTRRATAGGEDAARGRRDGAARNGAVPGGRDRAESPPESSAEPGRVSNPSGPHGTVKPLRRNSLTGEAGQEFLIENRFLYYMFTFGTELGNELFYITFFPFVIWNVDAFVGRRLITMWVWVMYLGQCTKDLLGWSRPASPPVVKVEMFYNSEYSMPSTHAMSGTAVPFSLFVLTYGRWEYPSSLGFSLAVCWCLLVCVSRIYMGMHSVLDVIVGVAYSALILLFFLPLLDVIDGFYVTSPWAPPLIVLVHLALGLFSFTLDAWSTSRSDTAQILGTGAGIALGAHVNQRLGLLPDAGPEQLPLVLAAPGAGLVGTVLLRLVLGVLVLFLTRALMKAITIPLACRLCGVPAHDVRKARQHMGVELPYRYIVYGTVGFNVQFLVPLLLSYLPL